MCNMYCVMFDMLHHVWHVLCHVLHVLHHVRRALFMCDMYCVMFGNVLMKYPTAFEKSISCCAKLFCCLEAAPRKVQLGKESPLHLRSQPLAFQLCLLACLFYLFSVLSQHMQHDARGARLKRNENCIDTTAMFWQHHTPHQVWHIFARLSHEHAQTVGQKVGRNCNVLTASHTASSFTLSWSAHARRFWKPRRQHTPSGRRIAPKYLWRRTLPEWLCYIVSTRGPRKRTPWAEESNNVLVVRQLLQDFQLIRLQCATAHFQETCKTRCPSWGVGSIVAFWDGGDLFQGEPPRQDATGKIVETCFIMFLLPPSHLQRSIQS